MREPLLTVQDVARLLGVPVSWVYEHAERGTLPSVRIGRYRRFVAEEIEAYIQRSRQVGVQSPGAQ
jgi:excisionase family DNA binding protein